jgi:hypothetical protein
MCRYGVLNITSDPHGVSSCSQYGESYLILKNVRGSIEAIAVFGLLSRNQFTRFEGACAVVCLSVQVVFCICMSQCRLRATFADMDSSSPSTSLATCEYYAHVLNNYTESELRAVVDVATGKAPWRASTCISQYKEIQIHGELKYADHVEAVVVHARHKTNPGMVATVKEFSERYSVPVVWMAETTAEANARIAGEADRIRREAEEAARLVQPLGVVHCVLRSHVLSVACPCACCDQESLRWECWACGVKVVSPDDTICPACSVCRPNVTDASAAYVWTCSECAHSNAGIASKCTSCSKPAPLWPCVCSVMNPNCNARCGVCDTSRLIDAAVAAVPWTCSGQWLPCAVVTVVVSSVASRFTGSFSVFVCRVSLYDGESRHL